jgi:predicted nucleic acid-binding protein
MAAGLTLDAGALIAAEKGEREVWRYFKEAVARGARVTVPAPALALAWRGNSAQVARLLAGCEVESMDESRAKRTGELLARARKSDVVDAMVTLGAVARGDAVLTSDPDDIRRLLAAAGGSINVIAL